MSTQFDYGRDAALRFVSGRLRPLPVIRSIDREVAIQASWLVSGAIFGLSMALILQLSVPATLLAVVIAGALSWLGRGVANLVLVCALLLALIGFAFQAAHVLSPNQGWNLSWLGPCALAGLVVLLYFSRRVGRLDPGWIGALVELVAALATLLLALRFVSKVSPVGSSGAGLFLTTEDNDAWINLVGVLHNGHGFTELTGSSIGAFGPVVSAYLAGVRAITSGIFSAALPLSSSPKVVLSAYGLLVGASPVVAALVVRRLLQLRSALGALLVWACATVLITGACIVWMGYGSLSAPLATLLTLAALYVLSVRERIDGRTSRVVWLASALLLFGAGSAWVALVPLAGAAIAVFCLPVLGFALRDFRRAIPTASLLLLAAAVMGLELLQQYRDVVDPIGGQHTLFVAGGATPGVSAAMQALMLVLLLAIVWQSSTGTRPRSSSSEPGYLTPLTWLVAYLAVVLLSAARQTGIAAGYGPTKLQYVIAAIWVALALAEVASRLQFSRSQLGPIAVVVVAVLWASTIQNGLVYDAMTRHWPTAGAKTIWFDTVEREVSHGGRVLCLPVSTLAPDPNSLDPWDCSRFASSVQGKDDGVANTWRSVTLGRLPVSDAVAAVKAATDKPWTIVVMGPIDQLHNPKGWWAPLAVLPGLRFVPVSG